MSHYSEGSSWTSRTGDTCSKQLIDEQFMKYFRQIFEDKRVSERPRRSIKMDLKERNMRMWIGFIWLKIISNGWLLSNTPIPCEVEVSRLFERLSDCQEGPYFFELDGIDLQYKYAEIWTNYCVIVVASRYCDQSVIFKHQSKHFYTRNTENNIKLQFKQ